MNKRLLLFYPFLLLLPASILAQSVKFDVIVADSKYLPQKGVVNLQFQNPFLNQLKQAYGITKMAPAYPGANYLFLRWVYTIECSNDSLIYAISQLNPSKIKMIGKPRIGVLQCNHPNDYGLVYAGKQENLDFIRADTAWCYSTGDTNVLIGITDGYVDTTHDEISNKRRLNTYLNYYSTPSPNPPPYYHGMQVAGVAIGQTNNNIGLASIGRNCNYASWSDYYNSQPVYIMSRDGIRIINGSWVWSGNNNFVCQHPDSLNLYNDYGTTTLPGSAFELEQFLFNAVYENGTVAVFSSGNGTFNAAPACDKSRYMFPASFNHNISVSSVGHLSGASAFVPPFNSLRDVHFTDLIGTDSSFNHNSRVDICAPGQNVKILNGSNGYTVGSGTSVAAPHVSGTIGLMFSANKHLSPYQVEWLLKKTAVDSPYLITQNSSLKNRLELGAGRLDAGEAVKKASSFNTNEPVTKTLYVKGFNFNTRCKPGIVGGLFPKIEPIIENKTPGASYIYRWVALFTNGAVLNDSTIEQPTIIASTGDTAYFMFEVIELDSVQNAGGRKIPCPKVASKQFFLKFQTNPSAADLALRDSHLDMLDEPNSQATIDPREWNIWDSPDLWNRHAPDGGLGHQNPEYFATDSNYLYVRVRNTGCAASPAYNPATKIPRLRLYWSKLSTGQSWDWDWKYEDVYSPVTGTFLPGGREITDANDGMPIPSVPAGKDTILRKGWRPVKPQDYDSASNNEMLVCGLARIETAATAPWGMTNEVINPNTSATGNVRNNNNVVIRNMVTLNYNTGNRKKRIPIDIINQGGSEQAFALELFNDKIINKYFSGNLSGLMNVTLFLGDAFGYWQAGGSHGTGILSVDESAQTIVWNGKEKLRLDSVMMPAETRATIILYPEIAAGAPLPFDMTDRLHFRQMLPSAAGAGDEVYGSVTMAIAIAAEADGGGDAEGRAANGIFSERPDSDIRVYPNPAHSEVRVVHGSEKPLSYSLTDIAGKTIQKGTLKAPEDNISIGHLAAGVYILEIRDEQKSVVKLVKW